MGYSCKSSFYIIIRTTLLDRETTKRPERRTALVAMELAKYNIDIAVLSETRFHASGSLNDLEYTLYWSGKPNGERREAGVGFAIKRDIVAKLTEMPHNKTGNLFCSTSSWYVSSG